MPMSPLFTIITVTYNAAATVERTMRSVGSQTCRLYEHIIMDGASTDDTLAIVRSLAQEGRTIIRSKPDNGLYDAMNKAQSIARGDYLIFLNAGDTFHSADTLQHIADRILENDYPGVVYGQTDLVDNDGKRIGSRHLTAPETLTLDSFKRGMLVCHQAFTVLRRIAPTYNTQYRFSADYEWCIVCLQHSRRNVYLPEVTIDYLSEGTTTANHKASLLERFRIMCTYFGTMPTIVRHIGFALRSLKRKFT